MAEGRFRPCVREGQCAALVDADGARECADLGKVLTRLQEKHRSQCEDLIGANMRLNSKNVVLESQVAELRCELEQYKRKGTL